MATIKLQPSGKVVLKDGKVSCSCCAPEVPCCMYIAQDYIYGDLPDQVVAGGVVLSKQDAGGYEFPIWYTDGQNDIQFSNYWLLSGPLTDYRTFESSCLIGTYIFIPFDEFDPPRPPILVEDQFANSYQITAQGESVIVTRTNDICIWTGENQYGPAGIAYSGDSPYIWFAYISLPEPFFGRDGEKQGFQSSPVGTYYGGITVS